MQSWEKRRKRRGGESREIRGEREGGGREGKKRGEGKREGGRKRREDRGGNLRSSVQLTIMKSSGKKTH